MGQKVNPHGLRVGIIKDWDSRWFVKDSEFGTTLVSDYKLRKYLKKTLFDAGIPKIEIERDSQKAKIIIHCAKPGMVIGQGGSTIETLKKNVAKMVGKPVSISVIEVRSPDLNAQLVAENIGAQLERRISFRRAMKQAIARTMKLGAKGIKISVSGLLGGADIARTEHYHEGTIPLQTIRADIDYGYHAALTKMGLIGIKVWIYRGEVLTAVKRTEKPEASSNRARDNSNQGRFGRQQQRNDRPGRPQGDRPYQPRGDRPPRNDRPQGGQGGRGGFGRNQQEQPHQGNFGNRKPLNQRTDYRQKQNAPDASKEVPQTQGEGGNNDVNA